MDPLQRALQKLKDFISNLDTSPGNERESWADVGKFFSRRDEGGLSLGREETGMYLDCLDALSDPKIVGKRYSRKAVERMMQTAILAALDIAGKRRECSPDARLEKAIRDLGASLRSDPHRWDVHMRVEGLASDRLPRDFGKVTFWLADEEHLNSLESDIDSIVDMSSDTPETKKSVKASIHRGLGDYIGSVVAVTQVLANDEEAALSAAKRELRLTLDIMNFYADVLFSPGRRVRVGMRGEAGRETDMTVLLDKDVERWSIKHRTVGPLESFSYTIIDTRGTGEGPGVTRISDILAKDSRNSLEERIVSAMQWAGRATAEGRPEESFLNYAIALECITLGSRQDTELSYRLRMRAALLLGRDLDERRRICRQVRDLYNVRSKIVHSGHYEVLDGDLNLIRTFAKVCIGRMLTEEPFLSMKTEDEIDGWLEDQLLASSE